MCLALLGLLVFFSPVIAQTPTQTIESDNPSVVATGAWTTITDFDASRGRYLVNSGAASLSLNFSGTHLEVIYVSGPDYGAFAVEVDGVVLRTVDANGPAALDQRAVFDYLSAGDHVLRVYPVGDATVAIDAFVVQAVLEVEPIGMDTDVPSIMAGPTDPSLVATLNNPSPADGDRFGAAVDIDGNRAIVGVPRDDAAATDAGEVRIYQRGTEWTLQSTLNGPVVSAEFGSSVGISGDFAIVGAPFNDTAGTDAGRAYIYQKNPAGNFWLLVATLQHPAPAAYDRFGSSVAINGELAIVGASGRDGTFVNEGAAYVYRYDGSTWQLEQTLANPFPVRNDQFGTSVDVSSDFLIVGTLNANRAYIYSYTGGTWSPYPALTGPATTNFSWDVAIDGRYAVVGASGDDTADSNKGAAHVYYFDGSQWLAQTTLYPPATPNIAQFGSSVAVDGDFILIGTASNTIVNGVGAAFLYQRSNSTEWLLESTLISPSTDYFGTAVDVSDTTGIVGDYNYLNASGTAYLYDFAYADATLDDPVLYEANPAQTTVYPLSITGTPSSGSVVLDITTNGQCSASLAQVTFTGPSTQVVTVSTINDDVDESVFYYCTVTNSINDALSSNEYDNVPDRVVNVRVIDNDAPAMGLGVPNGVTVDPITPTRIDVAWAQSTTDESGFRVDRSTNGGQYLEIATVGPNVTSYSDLAVVCGQTYSYRIRTDRGGLVSASSAAATQIQCAPEFTANVGGGIPARAGNCSRTNTRLAIVNDDMLPGTAYNIRYVFDNGGSPATYYHTRTYTATVKNPTASLILYPSVRNDYSASGILFDGAATTMPNPIFLRIEMESATGGPATCQRLEVEYNCSTAVTTVISEGNDCSAFPN